MLDKVENNYFVISRTCNDMPLCGDMEWESRVVNGSHSRRISNIPPLKGVFISNANEMENTINTDKRIDFRLPKLVVS